MLRAQPVSVSLIFLLCAAILVPLSARAAEPHWVRISSSHFLVVSDADKDRAREVNVRFEQMRTVFSELLMKNRLNLSEPLDIIALRTDEEYISVAPVRDGRLLSTVGFFLPGEDRNFVVLNLSREQSWRAVAYDFARTLLSFNYPPTQPWFDEGFAEYFSSLQLANKPVRLGGDPGLVPPNTKPFADLLKSGPWLPLTELFAAKTVLPGGPTPRDTMFSAQSWIVMHYLLSKSKLPETGTYFDLVQNQKVPIADAIQKAYGMTAAQLEQAVKDYFLTLGPLLQPGTANAQGANLAQSITAPPDQEIGTSFQELSLFEGQALVAEVGVRLPEHREQAIKQLQSMANDPKTDTGIEHRAMAWALLQKGDYEDAVAELARAAELDPKDPWLHYYTALIKYHMTQAGTQDVHGLANIIQDMQIVVDWNPEFAEAYNMLGMARLEGGGPRSAMQVMRAAIQLAPRNEQYLLNMAQIYIAAKEWDAATAMLTRLKDSPDPKIASSASKNLADLPTLRKYGLLPEHESAALRQNASSPAQQNAPPPPPTSSPQPSTQKQAADEDTSEDHSEQTTTEVQLDLRPVQFLKGKLVSVDCSQAPVAIVTISAGAKTLKLRTQDYKSLTLIGADQFSCGWTSRPVSVNFKRGGKADGDLVSLEVQ